MAENKLQVVSLAKLNEAVRAYGPQKRLASELRMTDTELSRLLHEHAPKLMALMAELDLEVVEAGHVKDLKRVLKAVL